MFRHIWTSYFILWDLTQKVGSSVGFPCLYWPRVALSVCMFHCTMYGTCLPLRLLLEGQWLAQMLSEYFVVSPSSQNLFTDPVENRAVFRFGPYYEENKSVFLKEYPWEPWFWIILCQNHCILKWIWRISHTVIPFSKTYGVYQPNTSSEKFCSKTSAFLSIPRVFQTDCPFLKYSIY